MSVSYNLLLLLYEGKGPCSEIFHLSLSTKEIRLHLNLEVGLIEAGSFLRGSTFLLIISLAEAFPLHAEGILEVFRWTESLATEFQVAISLSE